MPDRSEIHHGNAVENRRQTSRRDTTPRPLLITSTDQYNLDLRKTDIERAG